MNKISWLVIAYGILLIIGGITGYVISHSPASLIAGSLFGLLAIASGIGINAQVKFASYAALALTVILSCFFTYRFFLSYKFLPAGLMVVLSLLLFITLLSSRSLPCKKNQ